jgi:hypothetical protein
VLSVYDYLRDYCNNEGTTTAPVIVENSSAESVESGAHALTTARFEVRGEHSSNPSWDHISARKRPFLHTEVPVNGYKNISKFTPCEKQSLGVQRHHSVAGRPSNPSQTSL